METPKKPTQTASSPLKSPTISLQVPTPSTTPNQLCNTPVIPKTELEVKEEHREAKLKKFYHAYSNVRALNLLTSIREKPDKLLSRLTRSQTPSPTPRTPPLEVITKVWDKTDTNLKFGPVVPLFLQYVVFLILVCSVICVSNSYALYLGYESKQKIKTRTKKRLEDTRNRLQNTTTFKEIFRNLSSDEFLTVSNQQIKKLTDAPDTVFSYLVTAEQRLNRRSGYKNISVINFLTLFIIYILHIKYYSRRRKLTQKLDLFYNNKISNYALLLKGACSSDELNFPEGKQKLLLQILKRLEPFCEDKFVQKESFIVNITTSITYIKSEIEKTKISLAKCRSAIKKRKIELSQNEKKQKEVKTELDYYKEYLVTLEKKKKIYDQKISIKKKLIDYNIELNSLLLEEKEKFTNKNSKNSEHESTTENSNLEEPSIEEKNLKLKEKKENNEILKNEIRELRGKISELRLQTQVFPELETTLDSLQSDELQQEKTLFKYLNTTLKLYQRKKNQFKAVNNKLAYLISSEKKLQKKLVLREKEIEKTKTKKIFYAFITFQSIEDKNEILDKFRKLGRKRFEKILNKEEEDDDELEEIDFIEKKSLYKQPSFRSDSKKKYQISQLKKITH